jgi:hypothetical protein
LTSQFRKWKLFSWNMAQPLSIVPLFSCKYQSFIMVPINCPYKQSIIISDASLLKVLYSIIHSEFLCLTHNILEMIIFKRKVAKIMWCPP